MKKLLLSLALFTAPVFAQLACPSGTVPVLTQGVAVINNTPSYGFCLNPVTGAYTLALQTIGTGSNCSSAAGTCGASPAGSVTIAAAATTVTVSTTAVTANSQILLQFDASLGTKLGVTCNATFAAPWVSARTAGTSFVVTVGAAPTTNPACYSYVIVN